MNCFTCFLYFSLILVAKVKCQSDEEDEKFYPSQHDEDENYPTYPFQQYIQVRKSVSVEHVPLYASGSDAEPKVTSQRSDDVLDKAASSNDASSSGSYGGDEQHYYKPPLKEEIFLHKKQEVYEEKGYHDGHYDHHNHGDYARESQPQYHDGGHASEPSAHYSESHDQPSETQQTTKSRTMIPTEINNRYWAKKQNHESQKEMKNRLKIPADLHARRQQKPSMVTKPPVLRTSATNRRTSKATARSNRQEALDGFPARKAPDSVTQMTNAPESRSARRRPVGADDATSTRVLEHIANNLYDRDGHAVGFYKARSHIHCPDFIDFDLSSKSQKMGQGSRPKGKPRLSGLGPKIDCHKRKYWGEEILPSSVFMDPSESRHSEIKIGTMDDFLADIRRTFYG